MGIVKYFVLALLLSLTYQSHAAISIVIDGATYIGTNEIVITQAQGKKLPTGYTELPAAPNTNETSPQPTDNLACATTGLQIIDRDLPAGTTLHTFKRNQAYAFGFVIPVGQKWLLAYGINENVGNVTSQEKLITVSSCPGDFNTSNVDINCSKSGNAGSVYVAGQGSSASYYCDLQSNVKYYLNIRSFSKSTNEDSCVAGENCGFSLTINKF